MLGLCGCFRVATRNVNNCSSNCFRTLQNLLDFVIAAAHLTLLAVFRKTGFDLIKLDPIFMLLIKFCLTKKIKKLITVGGTTSGIKKSKNRDYLGFYSDPILYKI